VSNGPIAIIAQGTGFGESFLTRDDSEYVAHGSERGRTDFAPTSVRSDCCTIYLVSDT